MIVGPLVIVPGVVRCGFGLFCRRVKYRWVIAAVIVGVGFGCKCVGKHLAAFAHEAFFDPDESRIEMRLVSLRAQQVRVLGRGFSFGAQERIHTENSHKYTVEDFEALARRAGWLPFALWRDPQHLFSVHELIAP